MLLRKTLFRVLTCSQLTRVPEVARNPKIVSPYSDVVLMLVPSCWQTKSEYQPPAVLSFTMRVESLCLRELRDCRGAGGRRGTFVGRELPGCRSMPQKAAAPKRFFFYLHSTGRQMALLPVMSLHGTLL